MLKAQNKTEYTTKSTKGVQVHGYFKKPYYG